MAGIYIHIPFCKTRCIYCDFYSTTRSELTNQYIHALCKEIKERAEYLEGEKVQTIYIGGGTPSQLSQQHFEQLFESIASWVNLSDVEEITLEGNPDDLSPAYTSMLRKLPFNRISMGIQTFNEEKLRLLNRRHTAQQAIQAFHNCRNAGFNNISIDLIYGLPNETDEEWNYDLQQAISLNAEHISAYHLIYEEGTKISKLLNQKRIKEVDEESSLRFFNTLMNTLKRAGYTHYEISNFCKPNKYSKHNSSYWKGISYLGCGPAAHSFNKKEREWNIASLDEYIKGIENGNRKFEIEELPPDTRYNEMIITALRTSEGLNLSQLKDEFGLYRYNYCMKQAQPFIDNKKLEIMNNHLRLTQEGIFISDSIMSDLLIVI